MGFLQVFGDVLAPVALLCAVGWLAGRKLQLDPRPVARIAYFVFAPAFVLDVLLDADLSFLQAARLIGAMVLMVVIVTIAAFAIGRAIGLGARMTAALAVLVAFPNVGNFGFPILSFRFGDNVADVAAITFLASVVFSFAVAVTAATWGKGRPVDAILAALASPVVVITPVAIALRMADAGLPIAIDRAVDLMAGGMVPAMLVSLGMQIAATGRWRVDEPLALGVAVVLRLAAAPLVALAVGLGVGLDGLDLDVLTIQAAMPSAVFCSLIAIEHDCEPEFVTTSVVWSTLLGIPTLAAVLALV